MREFLGEVIWNSSLFGYLESVDIVGFILMFCGVLG